MVSSFAKLSIIAFTTINIKALGDIDNKNGNYRYVI